MGVKGLSRHSSKFNKGRQMRKMNLKLKQKKTLLGDTKNFFPRNQFQSHVLVISNTNRSCSALVGSAVERRDSGGGYVPTPSERALLSWQAGAPCAPHGFDAFLPACIGSVKQLDFCSMATYINAYHLK